MLLANQQCGMVFEDILTKKVMAKKLYINLQRIAIGALSLLSPIFVQAQHDNDDPCDALEISVNTAGLYCPDPDNFSASGATTTSVSDAPAVGCSTPNADIWFKFTATATSHRVTRSSISGTSNVGIAVYSSTAGSCTSLSLKSCTTTPNINLTGLTVGDVYYVRAWNASSTSSAYSFNLCVGAPPPVPVNDECANAIEIDDALEHGAYTDNATQSKLPADCTGWGLPSEAADAWFKFTADQTGSATVTAFEFATQPYITIERFNTCTDATPADCDDDAFDGAKSLTVAAVSGNTYYFRIYGNDALGSGSRGYFSIQAEGTPLPVAMSKLTATIDSKNQVVLNWITLTEQNNEGFFIERSENGKDFKNIGFNASKAENGNSTHQLSYSYNDVVPLNGAQYYRIKQQDIDGVTSYSNVAKADITTLSNIDIYPNPATDKIHIKQYSDAALGWTISVTNVLGVKVISKQFYTNEAVLEIAALPVGLYTVCVSTPSGLVKTAVISKVN